MEYPNSLQNQPYNLSPTPQLNGGPQNTYRKEIAEITGILYVKMIIEIFH